MNTALSLEFCEKRQDGAPVFIWNNLLQAWKRICEASRKEFELIYNRLGVTIQERGESFYNPFLGPLVTELMASGIAEESEGAKVQSSALARLVRSMQCHQYPEVIVYSAYLPRQEHSIAESKEQAQPGRVLFATIPVHPQNEVDKSHLRLLQRLGVGAGHLCRRHRGPADDHEVRWRLWLWHD